MLGVGRGKGTRLAPGAGLTPQIWGRAALATVCILLILTPVSAQTPDFYSRVSHAVDSSLRRREGVAIWFDLETDSSLTWGNPEIKTQRFRPGSIVKIILAEEAILKGLKPEYRCKGRDHMEGERRFCWTRKGHGDLDLAKALAQSCNLFFSRFGLQMGVSGLRSAFSRYPVFDLSDLALESFVSFQLGDFAIGDSPYLRVSPDEVTRFWREFLPKLRGPNYASLKQGLEKAVESGTASRAAVSGMELLGKTGTSDSERSSFKTDAWFLGAYPASRPRYGLVIFLREAYGFREPSQLAGKIFRIAKETLP